MKILGIETSCDETAASVVEDGVRILSNVVVSQIDIFAEYGGVIPEVAARSHLEAILPVIRKALSDAGCSWDDIDAIAVTHAPGLLGSLLVGTLTARTLAILHNKPLYAVHHLKSHVYANWIDLNRQSRPTPSPSKPESIEALSLKATKSRPESDNCAEPADGTSVNSLGRFVGRQEDRTNDYHPTFPLLALVISGGHTQILYMRGHNQFEIIGTTNDDAVGECFDKVAKILGLPYPGGPSVAKAATDGDSKKYKLPHPKVAGLNFSFSGLKTAVLRAVQKEVGVPISYPSHELKELLTPQQVANFAASFQKTAVDILIEKLKMALELHPETKSIIVAGGVSANGELRNEMFRIFPSGRNATKLENLEVSNGAYSDIPVYFPSPSLSGDNGAMVAAACYYEIQSGAEPVDPYALNIYPRISIEN